MHKHTHAHTHTHTHTHTNTHRIWSGAYICLSRFLSTLRAGKRRAEIFSRAPEGHTQPTRSSFISGVRGSQRAPVYNCK